MTLSLLDFRQNVIGLSLLLKWFTTRSFCSRHIQKFYTVRINEATSPIDLSLFRKFPILITRTRDERNTWGSNGSCVPKLETHKMCKFTETSEFISRLSIMHDSQWSLILVYKCFTWVNGTRQDDNYSSPWVSIVPFRSRVMQHYFVLQLSLEGHENLNTNLLQPITSSTMNYVLCSSRKTTKAVESNGFFVLICLIVGTCAF